MLVAAGKLEVSFNHRREGFPIMGFANFNNKEIHDNRAATREFIISERYRIVDLPFVYTRSLNPPAFWAYVL
jgi:hypothetical protein